MKLVRFCATDNVELDGILHQSEKNDGRVILAVHEMTSNCFKQRDEIIAKYANEAGIDFFGFNNRGSEIVKYIIRKQDGENHKELGGTAYEDVLDGYYDIKGAIIQLIKLGYSKIYLQGHSLGCTKIVYTYNRLKDEESELLKCIKGVILLSLVDIPLTLKSFLANKFDKYLNLAENREREGNELELMPNECFIHPVSAKCFLRYIRDNRDIDLINKEKYPHLDKLNNITVPLFMRWGNVNELILEDAKVYSERVNKIVENEQKDIGYIDGADHSYHCKEDELASQIVTFLEKHK